MEARSEFPRLIRGLIQRNNDQLVEVEMRAAEGTGAPGYDGVTRAASGTPFVPEGDAVWELGVGVDFRAKANDDYAERSKNPLGRDPKATTFVFVTPRQWTNKQQWVAAKKAERVWADVRVFDVDDIEQALELAPAVHARFSEMVGKPAHGAQSVEDWWEGFSCLTSPPVDPELVQAGRADEAGALLRLFEAESRLTTIVAASVDDVLAFVAASIMSTTDDQREDLLGRALIVRDAFTLRTLTQYDGLLILLPFEDDLRREARLVRSHHVVIRAEDGGQPDIALPAIDIPAFAQLLKDRGESSDRADDLARAAHRSIVMFQRRGAAAGSAAPPPWANTLSSRVTRRGWLAGKWNERRSGDPDALGVLFESSYSDAREELVSLTSGAEPLFVVVGETWKVASIEEAWQYGNVQLQPTDLAAFEILIQTVLGAVDPRLDLPVADRWMASVYGKARLHSSDLREGIAEVLALLGARGQAVTIGSETVQSWLRRVLFQLFQRANEDRAGQLWASLTDVLPLLAEAAPNEFLGAVQLGLDGEKPLLGAMFADEEGSSFVSVSSPHTGLLWGLENVAWSSEHFGLAVEQLARLAEVDPGGRLSNRPAASLASIFRPWLPQTSVDASRRVDTLDGLRERHPTVSWPLMLTMLPEHTVVGDYNHNPRFRDWKPEETGRIPDDWTVSVLAVADRLVEDAGNDPDRWVELVSRFDDLPPEGMSKAVERLESLGLASDGPELRAAVWEPLHALVQRHVRYGHTDWAMSGDRIDLLSDLQVKLAPSDPVARIRWLFDDHLPDLPEQATEDFDASIYMDAVGTRRRDEIIGLIDDGGRDAVVALARQVEYPWFVGVAVADARDDSVGQLLLECIDAENTRLVAAAAGWATRRGSQDWDWIKEVAARFTRRPLATARLLLVSEQLLPAWEYSEQDPAVDAAYWAEFSPYGRGPSFVLGEEASRKLLAHDRPRAALMLMNLYSGSAEIDRALVLEGLERLVETPEDHPDRIRVDSHEVERLLDYLREGEVDEERLGLLDWRLRPALRFDARSPILERKLAREPSFFVEVLSMAFKPRNREPERTVPPHAATNGYRLLDDWQIIPGTEEPGATIDSESLNQWMDEAVALLEEADRLEIGLDQIGKVLAKGPRDDDDTWPTRPVRDLIERISRSELDDGFRTAAYNSRGPTSRGLMDGGDQERQLSERHATLSEAVHDRWPRTAAILRSLAEGYEAEARRHDEDVERFREGLDR
jgi:hypothetical protein